MIVTIIWALIPLLFAGQVLGIYDDTKCGEILTEPTGNITYKEFSQLAPNERCTWIIRAPNTSDYTIWIHKIGFTVDNLTDTKLILFGLNQFRRPDFRVPSKNDIGYGHAMYDSNVVIVTLFSGSNPNGDKGFQISYEPSVFNTGSNVSSDSTDVFTNSDLGHIRHPVEPTKFINPIDLSTFVFAPVGNVYDGSRMTDVIYSRIGLLPDCQDNELQVYYLNVSAVYMKWELVESICGSTTTTRLQSQDMILVVFHNLNYDENSGFELTYTNRLIG